MKGGGRRELSPVFGLLPERNSSSGRPGRLGPWSSPGGLLKFGFPPGMGPRFASSLDIGGVSPGLLGGGPGDFGGIGLGSTGPDRCCPGLAPPCPPAAKAARPSGVAK